MVEQKIGWPDTKGWKLSDWANYLTLESGILPSGELIGIAEGKRGETIVTIDTGRHAANGRPIHQKFEIQSLNFLNPKHSDEAKKTILSKVEFSSEETDLIQFIQNEFKSVTTEDEARVIVARVLDSINKINVYKPGPPNHADQDIVIRTKFLLAQVGGKTLECILGVTDGNGEYRVYFTGFSDKDPHPDATSGTGY